MKLLTYIKIIFTKIAFIYCSLFCTQNKFNKVYTKLSYYKIKSIEDTSKILANSDKSLGRFGDGELQWMLKEEHGRNNFEKVSPKLSNKLFDVMNNNNDDFIIGLPDALKYLHTNHFVKDSRKMWKAYILKDYKKILKTITTNKQYYNTNVTRPYMDYNTRNIANNCFKNIKRIWKNKKILIIEGEESRVGTNDDLFKNASDIKRIECPPKNAFESYDKILNLSLKFLKNNPNYISLISLGPTATVLSYDLFKNGHRAIDIGHIDIEYEWYLIGAKEKINLPDKYINELKDGKTVTPVKSNNYNKQIIMKI